MLIDAAPLQELAIAQESPVFRTMGQCSTTPKLLAFIWRPVHTGTFSFLFMSSEAPRLTVFRGEGYEERSTIPLETAAEQDGTHCNEEEEEERELWGRLAAIEEKTKGSSDPMDATIISLIAFLKMQMHSWEKMEHTLLQATLNYDPEISEVLMKISMLIKRKCADALEKALRNMRVQHYGRQYPLRVVEEDECDDSSIGDIMIAVLEQLDISLEFTGTLATISRKKAAERAYDDVRKAKERLQGMYRREKRKAEKEQEE